MIQIRQTAPEEFSATEHVIREAFWNHYTSACVEHYLVHEMRTCPAYIPELDLVAAEDGAVVGSSLCLKSWITGDDGGRCEVLSLGPIGVLPEHQGQGTGSALIARAKELAKSMGFRAILLCGDPDYYTRQGFTAAEVFGIRNTENQYAAALHACALYEDALAGVTGRYIEDDIYHVDERLAAEYDKRFPPKEVVHGTPMQQKFLRISGMVKPYRPSGKRSLLS